MFPPQLTSCLFLLLPPAEHRSGLHLFLMALSSSRLISTNTNQARQQLQMVMSPTWHENPDLLSLVRGGEEGGFPAIPLCIFCFPPRVQTSYGLIRTFGAVFCLLCSKQLCVPTPLPFPCTVVLGLRSPLSLWKGQMPSDSSTSRTFITVPGQLRRREGQRDENR